LPQRKLERFPVEVRIELAVRRRTHVRHRLNAMLPKQLKEFFP
jgi:hypothetical protein